jgi:hypothetical protein
MAVLMKSHPVEKRRRPGCESVKMRLTVRRPVGGGWHAVSKGRRKRLAAAQPRNGVMKALLAMAA